MSESCSPPPRRGNQTIVSTSIKNIAVAVTSGLVVLAILGLFLEVRKAPAQPSALKIDEAAKKARTTRTAPSPMTVPDDPWARSTADAAARDLKRVESGGTAIVTDRPAADP